MLIVAVESAAGACPSSLTRRVPHCEQKRASSAFALPQLVQYGIGDRLLSNPQGRVEVDGCPEPTRDGQAVEPPRRPSAPSLPEGRLVRRGVQETVDRSGI